MGIVNNLRKNSVWQVNQNHFTFGEPALTFDAIDLDMNLDRVKWVEVDAYSTMTFEAHFYDVDQGLTFQTATWDFTSPIHQKMHWQGFDLPENTFQLEVSYVLDQPRWWNHDNTAFGLRADCGYSGPTEPPAVVPAPGAIGLLACAAIVVLKRRSR